MGVVRRLLNKLPASKRRAATFSRRIQDPKRTRGLQAFVNAIKKLNKTSPKGMKLASKSKRTSGRRYKLIAGGKNFNLKKKI